jgi:DNA primase
MNPKDQIKQTLSILDVVSTYVRLEKAGSQYKGRCPFHNEKSPSFFVSPDRGTYHCFGCKYQTKINRPIAAVDLIRGPHGHHPKKS